MLLFTMTTMRHRDASPHGHRSRLLRIPENLATLLPLPLLLLARSPGASFRMRSARSV